MVQRIVAQRGNSALLIQGDDPRTVRVFDLQRQQLSVPKSAQSVRASSVWDPYDGPPDRLASLLRDLEPKAAAPEPEPSPRLAIARRAPFVTFGPLHTRTGLTLVAKNGSDPPVNYAVLKAESQPVRQYTLGEIYPVSEVDAHGDYATAEDLENAAWSFMRRHGGVGLMHRGGTDGAGTVVESYIYRGPPWEINGETVEAGDWLGGVIWNDPAWQLILSGQLTGISIQGTARRSA